MPESDTDGRSTEGMVDYDANSLAQKQHALRNSDVISELAARISSLPGLLNFTDYGCGPGQSAIETVRPALATWQKSNPSRALSVCHADLPGNDWNGLTGLVFGETGYAAGPNAPLVQTAVGSFYERMVPDASVSLATCFFAGHWLRTSVRFHAPETIWFADLTGDARQQMWQRAEDDWTLFLRLRAEELQPGGYLYVSSLGAVPEEGEINQTAASGRGIYRALQAVTASMVEDGLLDRDAADHFVFGLWFMTEAEARKPFEKHADLDEAFEIDTIAVIPLDDGGDLFSAYLSDPVDYARRYTGYTKAFAATSLRAHLFEPGASAGKDAQWLEDEFFRRLDALYREKTSIYACEQWHTRVILRRR
ncbi:hypothetical protein [Roseibium sp. MMSF_3544]|uniref:hypothetical protein n=1 Tax=unclassified Roseibium TaxID=2629323 RepID=UPI00273F3987|nr:hypothetical protein [Roseibium sp. MMSF_3544]